MESSQSGGPGHIQFSALMVSIRGRRAPDMHASLTQHASLTHAPPHCLSQVSDSTWALVKGVDAWRATGGIDVKGKGRMDTYLWDGDLPGRTPAPAGTTENQLAEAHTAAWGAEGASVITGLSRTAFVNAIAELGCGACVITSAGASVVELQSHTAAVTMVPEPIVAAAASVKVSFDSDKYRGVFCPPTTAYGTSRSSSHPPGSGEACGSHSAGTGGEHPALGHTELDRGGRAREIVSAGGLEGGGAVAGCPPGLARVQLPLHRNISGDWQGEVDSHR